MECAHIGALASEGENRGIATHDSIGVKGKVIRGAKSAGAFLKIEAVGLHHKCVFIVRATLACDANAL